jgi:hypothetical protein
MADNTGQAVQNLRIRELSVHAPPVLAQSFNQHAFFDYDIDLLNLCGEPGVGSFSWLLRFDTTQQTLETGGAPQVDNPFAVPYCFFQGSLDGFAIAPATAALRQQTDGTLAAGPIAKLYIPFYFDGQANQAMVLPISNAQFEGMTLSAGGNCIGAYNPGGVTAPSPEGLCSDENPSLCQRWHTAGSVSGFITLKDADAVPVPGINASLCVLLTSANPAGGQDCPTDSAGNIVAQGDFCSQTNSPGGCADSFWMAATLAASAASIADSPNNPLCGG